MATSELLDRLLKRDPLALLEAIRLDDDELEELIKELEDESGDK
jgi:hypothetical protein